MLLIKTFPVQKSNEAYVRLVGNSFGNAGQTGWTQGGRSEAQFDVLASSVLTQRKTTITLRSTNLLCTFHNSTSVRWKTKLEFGFFLPIWPSWNCIMRTILTYPRHSRKWGRNWSVERPTAQSIEISVVSWVSTGQGKKRTSSIISGAYYNVRPCLLGSL